MHCPGCGKEVAESDVKCGSCGSSVSSRTASSPEITKPSPQRSNWAVANLNLGLICFAVLIAFFVTLGRAPINFRLGLLPAALVVGAVAIICGHRAKGLIRRSSGGLVGQGMATVGLIIGYLGLASSILLIAIAAFVHFVAYSRIAANQSAAVASLQRINTAATIYAEGYGGYPPSLSVLGPGKSGSPYADCQPSKESGCMLEPDLASGRKWNYVFTYVPGTADTAGAIRSYAIYADPTEPGVTGKLDFYTDQTCVIRFAKGKQASPESPPFGK